MATVVKIYSTWKVKVRVQNYSMRNPHRCRWCCCRCLVATK